MKDISHHSADARGRSRFTRKDLLEALGQLGGWLMVFGLIALVIYNYVAGEFQLYYCDGYVIKCSKDKDLNLVHKLFGKDPKWIKGGTWTITFKGVDGKIRHFSAEGRYRFVCYRRGYYGQGPHWREGGNVSIQYNESKFWRGDGDWYVQGMPSDPPGEILARSVKQPGEGEAQLVRLYYRPISKWVVDN